MQSSCRKLPANAPHTGQGACLQARPLPFPADPQMTSCLLFLPLACPSSPHTSTHPPDHYTKSAHRGPCTDPLSPGQLSLWSTPCPSRAAPPCWVLPSHSQAPHQPPSAHSYLKANLSPRAHPVLRGKSSPGAHVTGSSHATPDPHGPHPLPPHSVHTDFSCLITAPHTRCKSEPHQRGLPTPPSSHTWVCSPTVPALRSLGIHCQGSPQKHFQEIKGASR